MINIDLKKKKNIKIIKENKKKPTQIEWVFYSPSTSNQDKSKSSSDSSSSCGK